VARKSRARRRARRAAPHRPCGQLRQVPTGFVLPASVPPASGAGRRPRARRGRRASSHLPPRRKT